MNKTYRMHPYATSLCFTFSCRHTHTHSQRTPFSLVPPTTAALACQRERQEATFSKQKEAVAQLHWEACTKILPNFLSCFLLISPYYDPLLRVFLLHPRSWGVQCYMQRHHILARSPTSWLDWYYMISLFWVFFTIFSIFGNKINNAVLFWYYISCSSVKRGWRGASCQVFFVAFYAHKIQFFHERHSCLLLSNCIYHLSFFFSLFSPHSLSCLFQDNHKRVYRNEVLYAC